MTKLTNSEKDKLDNTCGNLRVTKLGTHVKTLEDFVNQGTLATRANDVTAAINELYAMIVNNDCATIQVPPPGFFTLFGDDETGKLMCYYNDEDNPPVFRHVDDSTADDYGALYLCIADSEGNNHYELEVGHYMPIIQLITIVSDEDNIDEGISLLYKESAFDKEYSLVLSSDKEVIQSGETATLTALLKVNNVPLINQAINFLVGDSSVDVVTDSNGEAEFEYVGSGMGLVSVDAAYCMLLQETYEIFDCLKYDNGNDSTHEIWTIWQDYPVAKTVGSEYTTITKATSTNGYMYTQSSLDDVCIEFEVYIESLVNTDIFMQLRDGSTVVGSLSANNTHLELNAWNTVKLTIIDGVFTNVNYTSQTWTLSSIPTRLYFACQGNTNEVRFKNLKIYSI